MSDITAKVRNPKEQAAYLASFPNGAMTKRTLENVSWAVRQDESGNRTAKRTKPTFLTGGSDKASWKSQKRDAMNESGRTKKTRPGPLSFQSSSETHQVRATCVFCKKCDQYQPSDVRQERVY